MEADSTGASAGEGRLVADTAVAVPVSRQRLGFLKAPLSSGPATWGRLEGYRSALVAAGIEPDDDLATEAEADQEGGYQGALVLPGRPDRPSALFCYNDRMAMGAYTAIAELGLRIPQDVAVIGFDNQEVVAAHLRPPLTTIALPHYEMGHRALNRLLALIHDEDADAGTEAIDCPLIERESV